MVYFPYVVAISTFCLVWSYGIQKRRLWAWHLGWGFAALVGAAIIYTAVGYAIYIATAFELQVWSLVPVGATCVWVFWARWWATQRNKFGEDRTDDSQRDS